MLVLTSTGQKNIIQVNGNQTSLVTNILQNVFFYVMFQGRKKKSQTGLERQWGRVHDELSFF